MNRIGIDTENAKTLSKGLGELLANYQVFYTNVRGFHWNIKGDKFFELHAKFEELYDNLNEKVDEIAERILTLGCSPEYRYSEYVKKSQIKEAEETMDGIKNMKNILENFQILITMQRNLLAKAGDANDEGTVALMSDYIREQEKSVWMYAAFLKE